jgi:hypothetical protein
MSRTRRRSDHSSSLGKAKRKIRQILGHSAWQSIVRGAKTHTGVYTAVAFLIAFFTDVHLHHAQDALILYQMTICSALWAMSLVRGIALCES